MGKNTISGWWIIGVLVVGGIMLGNEIGLFAIISPGPTVSSISSCGGNLVDINEIVSEPIDISSGYNYIEINLFINGFCSSYPGTVSGGIGNVYLTDGVNDILIEKGIILCSALQANDSINSVNDYNFLFSDDRNSVSIYKGNDLYLNDLDVSSFNEIRLKLESKTSILKCPTEDITLSLGINKIENKWYCSEDSDCVRNSCCLAEECVSKEIGPTNEDCDGSFCIQEWDYGIVIGCTCVDGLCNNIVYDCDNHTSSCDDSSNFPYCLYQHQIYHDGKYKMIGPCVECLADYDCIGNKLCSPENKCVDFLCYNDEDCSYLDKIYCNKDVIKDKGICIHNKGKCEVSHEIIKVCPTGTICSSSLLDCVDIKLCKNHIECGEFFCPSGESIYGYCLGDVCQDIGILGKYCDCSEGQSCPSGLECNEYGFCGASSPSPGGGGGGSLKFIEEEPPEKPPEEPQDIENLIKIEQDTKSKNNLFYLAGAGVVLFLLLSNTGKTFLIKIKKKFKKK